MAENSIISSNAGGVGAVPSPEAPLFLRKTYAMMDSCDPSIGGWSEDGTTFVIKNTKSFESKVIPQFFKHSKFTSFVRQLNFYAFRKLKYSEHAVRVQDEEATAQYWRFHHAKFQRGKPELLLEMKRTASGGVSTTCSTTNTDAICNANTASDAAMKQELEAMKKRMEELNRNMTELTSMVQRVSLTNNARSSGNSTRNNNNNVAASAVAAAVKQQQQAARSASSSPKLGAKRKKLVTMTDICTTTAMPDPVLSTPNMLVDEEDAEGLPLPLELVASSTELSFPTITADDENDDCGFMPMELDKDQLLPPLETLANAHDDGLLFSTDDALVDLTKTASAAVQHDAIRPDEAPLSAATAAPVPSPTPTVVGLAPLANNKNRPDPELMERLSEALAVLPKDMQELIVERLIAAILSTDSTGLLSQQQQSSHSNNNAQPMPLCAATVAALLTHYTAQCRNEQDAKTSNASNSAAAAKKNSGVKSIPVIPVHA